MRKTKSALSARVRAAVVTQALVLGNKISTRDVVRLTELDRKNARELLLEISFGLPIYCNEQYQWIWNGPRRGLPIMDMEKSATLILWDVAHRPRMEGNLFGVCRACGREDVGTPFAGWVRDTFTDHDKLVPGEVICWACQFAFDEASRALAYLVGKADSQRMRNYSHFVVGGQWIPLSKGDKRRMADILLHEHPLVAVIAVSGQKHLVFRARPGWWQVEELTMRPDEQRLFDLMKTVERLYNGGLSKGEIESGRYSQNRILNFGMEEWCALEALVKPARGSALLELALFLAQKDEDKDE